MRLLYQSHIYFAASVVLHIAFFAVLTTGSLHFRSRTQHFETTVEFTSSDEKKSRITTKTDETSKSPSEQGISSNLGSLSSKGLDELLKNRRIKVDPQTNLDKPIVSQKSDLLGYLRANKQTGKDSAIKDVTTPGTETQKPLQPLEVKSQPETNQQQNNPATGTTTDKKDAASTATATETDTTTEVEKPENEIPLARRIWQKKTENQQYRNILNRLVSRNWTLPPGKITEFQIVIEATIDKNGNVIKMDLLKSSGIPGIDATAERAIRVSTPFPELPETLVKDDNTYLATFRFTPRQVLN